MAKYSRPSYEGALELDQYEVPVTGHVVIYDDAEAADALATKLGTWAKHAGPRHRNSCWHTFSVVALPSDKG